MTPSPSVHASAPARIDLAGGTLDIWPISVLVPDALTVNLAVELRAEATLHARSDDRVRVVSRDRRRRATRRLPLDEGDVAGPLSLVLRLVEAFAPRAGVELHCRATAPAGAGLGGSSTLAIAVGAALARFNGVRLSRAALLRKVMNLEARELGVPTGNQDYLAALHGGLSAYRHTPDGTLRERLRIPSGLQERLVLAYTGRPRHSGFSNWDMFRRFVEGERTTVRRLERIAEIAGAMTEALRREDLDAVGRRLDQEGRLRARLAPSVETPEIRRAAKAARAAGALGVKICGAGGGGCLVAFARAGRNDQVAAALRGAGTRVLDAPIARAGLRVSSGTPGSGS